MHGQPNINSWLTLLFSETLDEVGYVAVVSKLVIMKLSEYVSTGLIFVHSVDMCRQWDDMFILKKLTRVMMDCTSVQCGVQTCVCGYLH